MLRAGFSQIDISPSTDCGLVGYEFRQEHLPPGNDGVHDPLLARVLVIEPGQQPRAVIVSLDLCVIPVPGARLLRQVAARAAGTTPDRVMVSCTHTHSGPFPMLPGHPRGMTFTNTARADRRYGKQLVNLVRSATATAASLTYRVDVTVQESPLGFAYNRRVITPDGVRHCWNPQEQTDLNPSPATDPTCTAVVLRQKDGPRRFILWSASAHPVVLGKTSRVVSADWPGAACRLIDTTAPHTHSLFLLGPCGELHPWIATQELPANIQPVASAAAGLVGLLSHATRTNTRMVNSLHVAAKTTRIRNMAIDLAAWQLGPATILAGPVELFNSVGATIRRELDQPLIIATNTNGWTGYWPDPATFAEGGYEINAARAMGRKPSDTPRLVKAWKSLARGQC
jgi:hypothetical protein